MMRGPGLRATRTVKGLQPQRSQPFFVSVWLHGVSCGSLPESNTSVKQ